MTKALLDQPEVTEDDINHLDEIDHESCKYDGRPLEINLNNIEDTFGF